MLAENDYQDVLGANYSTTELAGFQDGEYTIINCNYNQLISTISYVAVNATHEPNYSLPTNMTNGELISLVSKCENLPARTA